MHKDSLANTGKIRDDAVVDEALKYCDVASDVLIDLVQGHTSPIRLALEVECIRKVAAEIIEANLDDQLYDHYSVLYEGIMIARGGLTSAVDVIVQAIEWSALTIDDQDPRSLASATLDRFLADRDSETRDRDNHDRETRWRNLVQDLLVTVIACAAIYARPEGFTAFEAPNERSGSPVGPDGRGACHTRGVR